MRESNEIAEIEANRYSIFDAPELQLFPCVECHDEYYREDMVSMHVLEDRGVCKFCHTESNGYE